MTLPAVPFDLLAFFFDPINFQKDAENDENCGYYFIPYDFIDLVHQANGLWWVDVMDVEFSESSYVRGKNEPGDEQVLKATHEQTQWKWISHTPWLQDDTMLPRFK